MSKLYKKHVPKPAVLTSPKQKQKKKKRLIIEVLQFCFGLVIGIIIVILIIFSAVFVYDNNYRERIYPGITVANIPVGGKTPAEVADLWFTRNEQFANTKFTLFFENQIATLSAQQLDIGFDATLSATQAYSLGRTGDWFTDTYYKYLAWQKGINFSPLFRWNKEILDESLIQLSQVIDVEAVNALFEFHQGRVTVFKPANNGRKLDTQLFRQRFTDQLTNLANQSPPSSQLLFELPVEEIEPLIRTERANEFGIKELLGQGESFFRGSIAGRIHNIVLASSRINGVLISPGETFSFNDTVGDISAATGYKQAYVIKSGRTVLDDGGGVCQVSTTLFRAALNTGLPIIERHAHSYRVAYYEQGGWKPGFDATVYAPSYDLKIKNDTSRFILIQAKADTANLKLTFELYGTKDGRSVEISPVRLWDAKPAPPDLNQDDPTLPNGTVKQVDWAAAGIKAAFDYNVKKEGEELFKKTFVSNFIPWQAVYLHGTAPQ